MLDRNFVSAQLERFEIFEGFPRAEFQPVAVNEYVDALMRCRTTQHCREAVTHFIETAKKYPSIATLLDQIRITAPPEQNRGPKCPYCVQGWVTQHILVEEPRAKPQAITAEEAKRLLERIQQTKNCRSMVYETAVECKKCFGAAHGTPEYDPLEEPKREKTGPATRTMQTARQEARKPFAESEQW